MEQRNWTKAWIHGTVDVKTTTSAVTMSEPLVASVTNFIGAFVSVVSGQTSWSNDDQSLILDLKA